MTFTWYGKSAKCLDGGENRWKNTYNNHSGWKTSNKVNSDTFLEDEILQELQFKSFTLFSGDACKSQLCLVTIKKHLFWFCEKLSWERSYCHVPQQFKVIQTCGWFHYRPDSFSRLRTFQGTDSRTTATHCLVFCACTESSHVPAGGTKIREKIFSRSSVIHPLKLLLSDVTIVVHKTSVSFEKRKNVTFSLLQPMNKCATRL